MLLHESPYGPQYYCFDNLSRFSGLVHGVFTRNGGSSKNNFKSLNVGLSTGDNKESVYLNRRAIAKTMGIDEKQSVYLNQVHGKEFLLLKDVYNTKANNAKYQQYQYAADGIVSNIKEVLTVMQVADCQAIILYDPENKVIANLHSGWRGSILNIAGRGVEIMMENFGTNPSKIIAAVAPSLGPCCAEFKNYRDEIPEEFWKYRIDVHEYHFDFWQMSRDQLTEKGVLPQNIEVSRVCTPCTSHLFYSYRKEKITGRFAVAVGLI
ncbi:MAG: peptidoglycan editing factor PgeF [Desulfamplus sp.]|nr:peptidoglycan editing factor PgeF [Desulfamplus sp.]